MWNLEENEPAKQVCRCLLVLCLEIDDTCFFALCPGMGSPSFLFSPSSKGLVSERAQRPGCGAWLGQPHDVSPLWPQFPQMDQEGVGLHDLQRLSQLFFRSRAPEGTVIHATRGWRLGNSALMEYQWGDRGGKQTACFQV